MTYILLPFSLPIQQKNIKKTIPIISTSICRWSKMIPRKENRDLLPNNEEFSRRNASIGNWLPKESTMFKTPIHPKPIPQISLFKNKRLKNTVIICIFMLFNKLSHFILYKNKPSIQILLPDKTRDVFS